MDSLTKSDIEQLNRHVGKPFASVYMSTHPTVVEGLQDEIRLRNDLDQVEEWLREGGMRGPAARDFVQPARALAADEGFWKFRSQGLAVFVAPGFLRAFRLPEMFEELVFVGDRFHLKPLLGNLSDAQRFLVLAFSQKGVRLLEGSRIGLRDIEVTRMPHGIESVVEFTDVEHVVQMHSMIRVGTGRRVGAFHGQGGEREMAKANLAEYCRDVNTALAVVLHDETAPLVIVAVGSVQPILKEQLSYAHLTATCVEGNPDHWSNHELHQRTWPIAESALDAPRREILGKLRNVVGTNRASTQISEVLRAAASGRVDSVVANRSAHCWGEFDSATLQTQVHERPPRHADDLLDLAIHYTLRNSGHVYIAADDEMPNRAEVVAMYRYT